MPPISPCNLQAEIAALQAKISHVTGLYYRAKRETRRYAAAAARAMAAAENAHSREGGSGNLTFQGHYSNGGGEDSDDQLQFRLNGIDGPNDSRKNGFYNQYHRNSTDG